MASINASSTNLVPARVQVTDPIAYSSDQLQIGRYVFRRLVDRRDAELDLASSDSEKLIGDWEEKPDTVFNHFFGIQRNIQNWKKHCVLYDSESDPREVSFRFGDQVFAVVPVPTPKDKEETVAKVKKQAAAYLLRHPIYRFEFLQYEQDPIASLSHYFTKGCDFAEGAFKVEAISKPPSSVEVNATLIGQKLYSITVAANADLGKKTIGVLLTKALGIRPPSLTSFLKSISEESILSKLPVRPVAKIVTEYLDGDFLYVSKPDLNDQEILDMYQIAYYTDASLNKAMLAIQVEKEFNSLSDPDPSEIAALHQKSIDIKNGITDLINSLNELAKNTLFREVKQEVPISLGIMEGALAVAERSVRLTAPPPPSAANNENLNAATPPPLETLSLDEDH
jgi:hypothetical protein